MFGIETKRNKLHFFLAFLVLLGAGGLEDDVGAFLLLDGWDCWAWVTWVVAAGGWAESLISSDWAAMEIGFTNHNSLGNWNSQLIKQIEHE